MRIKKINKFLKLILGKNIIGITLSPFGIYMKFPYNTKTLNHEKIHWKQQIEMLVLPFYLLYTLEYLIRLLLPGNAYRNLSFEREAYNNDNNLNYLKSRKKFSCMKYILKKN